MAVNGQLVTTHRQSMAIKQSIYGHCAAAFSNFIYISNSNELLCKSSQLHQC